MEAVRVTDWGARPELIEVDDASPGPDETLVRIEAATVGHLDRTIWSGRFLQPPALPYTPGVEGAGRVVESSRHRPGDRVWLRGGGLGVRRDGTWATLVAAPDDAVGVLPDAVSIETGSAFFSPCTSAWVALHDIAGVEPGERVLVTGANGAVGSIAAQLAHELGCDLTVLARDGSTDVPDARVVTDAGAAEGPFDVVIETVGGPVFERCLEQMASGGRCVAVGYVAGTDVRFDLAEFVQRNAALLPLNMIAREQAGRAAVPAVLERLADGRLRMPVTRFGFDAAGDALEWLTTSGRRGRAVLVPDTSAEAP